MEAPSTGALHAIQTVRVMGGRGMKEDWGMGGDVGTMGMSGVGEMGGF